MSVEEFCSWPLVHSPSMRPWLEALACSGSPSSCVPGVAVGQPNPQQPAEFTLPSDKTHNLTLGLTEKNDLKEFVKELKS